MLKLYTDAAVKGNPGLAGAGIIIVGDGIHEQIAIPLSGKWDNHEAEWQALYLGLDWLIEHNKKNQLLTAYTDSKLVAQAIQKKYVKQERFQQYLSPILTMLDSFPFAEVSWVSEKENKGADNLAKQALRKTEK